MKNISKFNKPQKLATAPVLFLIFNRPEPTQKVLEAIRIAKPPKLYIAADGPRDNNISDVKLCQKTRMIATEVDWDCQLITHFQESNLGCGKAISQAISWFFEQEEEGIILEDDCLPSTSFFGYCTELLNYYRYDKRVMQIAGNNLNTSWLTDDEHSYSFSNHTHIWGWATWRRAWNLFDIKMPVYNELLDKDYFKNYFHTSNEYFYKKYVFDNSANNKGKHDSWSYQWDMARISNAGLTIIPHKNLILNIGFGTDATHTSTSNKYIDNLSLEDIELPLKHRKIMMVDKKFDNKLFRAYYTTLATRIKSQIKKFAIKIIPGFTLKWTNFQEIALKIKSLFPLI